MDPGGSLHGLADPGFYEEETFFAAGADVADLSGGIFTVAAPLIYVAGRVSRGAGLAALAVAFVISFSISYYALGRYRKWLAEQEAEDQEKQA